MDEQITVKIYVGDNLITEKVVNGCNSYWFDSCPFHDTDVGCNIGGVLNYNTSDIPNRCPLRKSINISTT